jgi:hypothetical protein
MRIAKGHIVPLGYGKYFRADSIVGLEPLEEGRGPGKRARVYIENLTSTVQDTADLMFGADVRHIPVVAHGTSQQLRLGCRKSPRCRCPGLPGGPGATSAAGRAQLGSSAVVGSAPPRSHGGVPSCDAAGVGAGTPPLGSRGA